MSEHDTLLFLLSLATLLGAARFLGEIARTFGLPLVVGEMVAGIALGPTLLGRLAPSAHKWLFPSGVPAQHMLGAYTTLASILLLFVAGLEVDLSVVLRRGRVALLTSLLGLVLPIAGGFVLGMSLPDSDLVHPNERVIFAIFIGLALSISALPVIAKTLLDLGLFKTDLGLLIMAAAMIDDLAGWIGFSVLAGPMRGGSIDLGKTMGTVVASIAFVGFCFVVARKQIDSLIGWFDAHTKQGSSEHTGPGRILSFIILAALVGASITLVAGVHAVFGGFIVGVMVGDSPRLKEHTRVVIEQFVLNIFAPVFFASLGLRVDFVSAFDPRLCALVFVLASITKIVGCTLGAHVGGLNWRESGAVGFGLNARGAMGIIFARLAHEAGLIKTEMFVALVVMALATSLMAGPAMKGLLYKPKREDVVELLKRGAFLPSLHARTPQEAIAELAQALTHLLGPRSDAARDCVLEREIVAPTGLGDEVAIPHAAVDGLNRPILALGLSKEGIDFDAPDGRPARIVFMLLVPSKAYEDEVRLLASISLSVYTETARANLLESTGRDEMLRAIDENVRNNETLSLRPQAT